MARGVGALATGGAVLVSLLSLSVSIWFGYESRERDFLFNSVERLDELLAVIVEEDKNNKEWQDKLKRNFSVIVENGNSNKENASDLLYSFMRETMRNTYYVKSKITLYQFVIEEKQLNEINSNSTKTLMALDKLRQAMEKRQNTEKHLIDYANASDEFWNTVRIIVTMSINKIGSQLQKSTPF